MRTRAKIAAGILLAALLLHAACGCHREAGYSREADRLDSYPKYSDVLKSMHPVRVYRDNINTVVVQGVTNGVEYGKYITPIISSHRGIDSGFRLSDLTGLPGLKRSGFAIDMGDDAGLAMVCDYQISRPAGSGYLTQPFPSGTNPPSGVAGSPRWPFR